MQTTKIIDPSGMSIQNYSSLPNSPDISYHYTDPHVGAGYEMWSNVRGAGGSGGPTFAELQLQYGTTYEQQAMNDLNVAMIGHSRGDEITVNDAILSEAVDGLVNSGISYSTYAHFEMQGKEIDHGKYKSGNENDDVFLGYQYYFKGETNRPLFSNLQANYLGDKYTSPEVYQMIGGKVYQNYKSDPKKYANSCALRMSYALNKSGAKFLT